MYLLSSSRSIISVCYLSGRYSPSIDIALTWLKQMAISTNKKPDIIIGHFVELGDMSAKKGRWHDAGLMLRQRHSPTLDQRRVNVSRKDIHGWEQWNPLKSGARYTRPSRRSLSASRINHLQVIPGESFFQINHSWSIPGYYRQRSCGQILINLESLQFPKANYPQLSDRHLQQYRPTVSNSAKFSEKSPTSGKLIRSPHFTSLSNFQSPEVVDRGSETQLQVTGNLN